MLNTKTILMSAAALAVISAPALADKKMKEVTSIVGYNVTETQTPTGSKAKMFAKMDANSDGALSYKEYSRYSKLDDKYSVYLRMDRDSNKAVSYNEYASFNNTGKGSTEFESELHGKSVKGTNLKTRVITPKKSYYVPVEPEVVSIEDVTVE